MRLPLFRQARTINTRLFTRVVVRVAVLCCLILGSSAASGQEKNPQRGFQIGNAYSLSDIETINTTNGNLILNFGLGSLAPGRGGLSGGITLTYNSKLYDSTVEELEDGSNQLTSQNMIRKSLHGGWKYGSSLDYSIKFISRSNVEGGPFQCSGASLNNNKAVYVWKVKIVYPDGAEREFRPAGYNDIFHDGYFNVSPIDGQILTVAGSNFDGSCNITSQGYAPNPLTYYSTDGTYTRLTLTRGVGWTLSFSGGSRIMNNGGALYLYDRNDNYITFGSVTLPNGHIVDGMS